MSFLSDEDFFTIEVVKEKNNENNLYEEENIDKSVTFDINNYEIIENDEEEYKSIINNYNLIEKESNLNNNIVLKKCNCVYYHYFNQFQYDLKSLENKIEILTQTILKLSKKE